MSGWTDLIPSRWSRELRWSRNYPERVAHLLAAKAVVALDDGWQPVLQARCCFMS
jgi:hypothetical protein